ncbi:MAG: hypothetical protein E7Z89_07340 [Cyanobacteria bacterium SIG28]|nr:hypothetical protein [Cyanobacteria bacterium SIG28]
MKPIQFSLNNFLLILIIMFLIIGINILSDINNHLIEINTNVNTIVNNTYATLLSTEKNNMDNKWTIEKYSTVRKSLDDLWSFAYQKNK